jgi:outer membrane murein-binding lipoprotein Lpp
LTARQAGSTIGRMEAEIAQLENRVEQLIGLHEAGKAEIRDLRMRVARLEADNRALTEKVRLATRKLEDLLEKLPEG